MKNYKYLIIITLLTCFFSCKSLKDAFSIKSDSIKTIYKQNESVNLIIENPKNFEIDQVIYFSNDVEIGKSNKNEGLKIKLENLSLGNQSIKAKVFSDDEVIECFVSFDVYATKAPVISTYELINTYKHDKTSYTQGFEFFNGDLVEGTGQNGKSVLRKTNAKTGEVLKNIPLDEKYFGEGITVFNNKIYQLTWQEQVGFIYNAQTLEKEKTFNYFKTMEGWGLTHNETDLIMSDGSENIYFLDPNTQKLKRQIAVCSDQAKIDQINELEYINGKIWANIYQKNIIVIINPKNGAVENVIDLAELEKKIPNLQSGEVLNGIAYNPTTKTVFVTGKNWDKTFEIKLK